MSGIGIGNPSSGLVFWTDPTSDSSTTSSRMGLGSVFVLTAWIGLTIGLAISLFLGIEFSPNVVFASSLSRLIHEEDVSLWHIFAARLRVSVVVT